MDPITTAIIATITSGVTKVGQQAISDTYTALKNLLMKKFGDHSEVVKSIEGLEAKPDSSARKELLAEEVISAKVDQDPDILRIAQNLLDLIRSQPSGEKHIQQAIGNYIAQADRHSSASVNVSHPKEV